MIHIRKALLSDLQPLAKLFDAYRVFYRKTSDYQGAMDFLEQRLLQKDAVIFIAEENKTMLGFTQLYPLYSSTNMRRLWLLNDLFVAPPARQKGVGKALLHKAQEHCIATNAQGLSLETEKTNAPGNALYPQMGFVRDQEHHFYFWENPTLASNES